MNFSPKGLILVTAPSLVKPSYCNYLLWIGSNSALIPPGSLIPDNFSGLILSGGGDVHPDIYGGNPSLCVSVDRARDELEFELLKVAFARKIPILGICRGIQVLNVFLGGTLLGHIEGHSAVEGEDRRHAVNITPGTRLRAILGTESLEVNSAHHQALRELGKGLIVSAAANDGTIEAVELPGDHFVIGVQWHPERDKDEEGNHSFSSLMLREAFMREVSLFNRQ
jgi:putative glutamine amidotransferase